MAQHSHDTSQHPPERRILLLGAPRLERDRALIQVERRKAVALLAYLVVVREFVSREQLAAMFWPDTTTTRALAYLRTTLWTLNTALGDDWCVVDGGLVAFNGESGIIDDVSQFQTLAERDDLAALAEAVELWRGSFMHGFNLGDSAAFEEWQFFRAAALRDQLTGVLRHIIDRLTDEADPERALTYVRRWLTLDPTNETAHRTLMTLYAQSGQRNAALRQYQEAVRLLDEGLGVAPEPETVALYDAIRDGRVGRSPSTTETSDAESHAPAENSADDAGDTQPDAIPVNLPVQTTPFVGRETELAEITRLLADPDCRLLTLAGAGGIGKTRLAIEAARRTHPLPPDGIFFASLAPLRSAEFIPQTLIYALNFCEGNSGEGRGELLAYLRDKNLLLVVDNFEHVLAGADLLSEILAAAPGVKILATSRERLQLQEEWLYELRGLDYPTGAVGEPFESYSAVELFLQGARRVRSQFTLRPDDASAVIEICRLVDGMPLGIELAATWVQMLTCREIADNIQRSIDFLSTDLRNIPQRHRNLRAVIEVSWQSLSFDEQACLSRLSVFCGGFTLDAAREVSGASLQLLRLLVSKSLVRREDSANGSGGNGSDGRYTMHELLRQFAEYKLPSDENNTLHDVHSAYFMNFLAALIPSLKNADQPAALDAIQANWDDIVGAWVRAVHNQRWDLIAEGFEAFYHFAYARRRIVDVSELMAVATHVLRSVARTPAEYMLRVRMLTLQADGVTRTANRQAVVALVDEIVDLFEPYLEQPEMALTLTQLGMLYNYYKRDNQQAEQVFERALRHAETLNDPWIIGYVHMHFGWFCQNNIRYAEARRHFEQGLDEFRKSGQPFGIAKALEGLGENHATLGDYDTANRLIVQTMPIYEALKDTLTLLRFGGNVHYFSNSEHNEEMVDKALQMVREMGDKPGLAWSLYHAAWSKMNYKRRDLDAVAALFAEALPIFEALDDIEGRTWTRVFLGELALHRNDPDTAERIVTEALIILETQDFPWSRAGGWFVMGNVALARGDLEQAMHYYVDALMLARELEGVVQMLRHILGVIDVLLRREMGEPSHLYAVLKHVAAHQAAANDTYDRAEKLLAQVEPGLTSQELASALALSKTLKIEEIVDHYLALVAEAQES